MGKMKTNMKCPVCKGKMIKIEDRIIQDGIDFEAYKCSKCGEELLGMEQLKQLAEKYRELRKSKEVVFSKWGNSLAVRIPAEYAEDLHIKSGKKGIMTKADNTLKIMPI